MNRIFLGAALLVAVLAGAVSGAPAARVTMLAPDAEALRGARPLLEADAKRMPDHLRAFSAAPAAAKPFAELLHAVVYGDSLEPEVKLAMGLAVAKWLRNPYVFAHTSRALKASARGRAIFDALESGAARSLAPADVMAIEYAERLTADVHGIGDEEFRRTRAHYNDSQIVELTMTVCFFNYFARLAQGLGLEPEPWLLEPVADVGATLRTPRPAGPVPRIGLITDEEFAAFGNVAAASKAQPSGGLGLGIANSQRAMMRSPDAGLAWRHYGATARSYDTTGRELKLQVSFAVSNANGCRYCVVHQVVGLRRLGVDPNKLVAMMKDDSALTPRELVAVTFARKLTKEPASVGDADWAALEKEFGEAGAMEVLMQTCAFAFMNRFTDNLGLPSEEEALRIYDEVYRR